METSVSGRGAPVVSKSGLRSQGTGSLSKLNHKPLHDTTFAVLRKLSEIIFRRSGADATVA